MKNEITPAQLNAINAALALYDDKIGRIQESMHLNNIWLDQTTKGGKPTAKAEQAAARIAHGQSVVDQLIAERNALANAFGIIS